MSTHGPFGSFRKQRVNSLSCPRDRLGATEDRFGRGYRRRFVWSEYELVSGSRDRSGVLLYRFLVSGLRQIGREKQCQDRSCSRVPDCRVFRTRQYQGQQSRVRFSRRDSVGRRSYFLQESLQRAPTERLKPTRTTIDQRCRRQRSAVFAHDGTRAVDPSRVRGHSPGPSPYAAATRWTVLLYRD